MQRAHTQKSGDRIEQVTIWGQKDVSINYGRPDSTWASRLPHSLPICKTLASHWHEWKFLQVTLHPTQKNILFHVSVHSETGSPLSSGESELMSPSPEWTSLCGVCLRHQCVCAGDTLWQCSIPATRWMSKPGCEPSHTQLKCREAAMHSRMLLTGNRDSMYLHFKPSNVLPRKLSGRKLKRIK